MEIFRPSLNWYGFDVMHKQMPESLFHKIFYFMKFQENYKEVEE